jgi:Ni,Fe-hydrogenase III large subunit
MSDQEIINKKNISALAGAEKISREKFSEILDRLEKVERTLATLTQEMALLRQQSIIANKVIGPTA